MLKPLIIIPSRLGSNRLQEKALKMINGQPMICHVWSNALKADLGPVVVATDSEKISNVIDAKGGNAILTDVNHHSGSDRIYEALCKFDPNFSYDLIINLQGDMPNIEPQAISDLINYMQKGNCDIGTLASSFSSNDELADENTVKVAVKEQLIAGKFSEAIDFFRVDKKKYENYHHHIGIYALSLIHI